MSKKIPFVYDYADEDDNPNPGYIFNSQHGTHVAGIAAANAPELRGVAPNAQIIAAKVAGDGSGIQDRAVLDALDDALILKPDIINLSLVRGGGMSSEAGSVYDGVLKACARGMRGLPRTEPSTAVLHPTRPNRILPR